MPASVRLVPASPGTGVIAGAAVRAMLEMLGVQDCLTKSFGSNNPEEPRQGCRSNGLEQLRSKELIESLRGRSVGETEVEEMIARGAAFIRQTRGARVRKATEETSEPQPRKRLTTEEAGN